MRREERRATHTHNVPRASGLPTAAWPCHSYTTQRDSRQGWQCAAPARAPAPLGHRSQLHTCVPPAVCDVSLCEPSSACRTTSHTHTHAYIFLHHPHAVCITSVKGALEGLAWRVPERGMLCNVRGDHVCSVLCCVCAAMAVEDGVESTRCSPCVPRVKLYFHVLSCQPSTRHE